MTSKRKTKLKKLKQELKGTRSEETILKLPLPDDPVEFFIKVLHITPYPYQAAFLRDPNPLKVLRWCRRAGKTTVMSGADIEFAVKHPNSRIIVTMPKYQQVKEIYFQGEGGLHSHLAKMDKEIYERLIEEELQTIIRFTNKTVILAETPEPFTIRGHGPSKISIDEFNFFRKDRDLWLSALLPMTLTKRVEINVASTPWNKDSVYYDMCFSESFKIFSGNVFDADPPRYLRTYADVMVPNGPLDPQQVQIMRDQYAGDPWRWRREMECAFIDDESAFLPSSLIIKCQNEALSFLPFEENVSGNFYIGWDLGRERDHNAVAVIQRFADYSALVHCQQFPLGTPYVSVMGYIKSLCDRWQTVHTVYYDHTGTKGMDEEIDRAGFPGVLGIDYTKPRKHGMATLLKQQMLTPRASDSKLLPEDARRKFELPFDKDVQAELNVEQWEQPAGSEVYSFSHPEGTHDDRFWAICMAVYASLHAPLPGTGAFMLPH